MRSLPAFFRRLSQLFGICLCSILSHQHAVLLSSQAQVMSAISSDGTLGTSISQNGSVFDIQGGTIQGSNQFHSFDRFTVGTGDTASFNGPNSISNILSRVTGLQQSVIDGTLQSTISGANLYLLNPAGVLFGPNASLNVSGSFHVSTADFIRMEDGAEFHADLSQTSTLSIAPPEAFGFLTGNPAELTVDRSSLTVPTGETLSLIGGDITIAGDGTLGSASLIAPEGQVTLTNLAATSDSNGIITLSDGAFINVSGNSGGTISIRGGEFVMDRSLLLADTRGSGEPGAIQVLVKNVTLFNGAAIGSDALGAGPGGTVSITATNTVTISGTSRDGSRPSSVFANSPGQNAQAGNAGNIIVNAKNVTVADGGLIVSNTSGPGQGGTVSVVALDTVSLSGTVSNGARTFSSGVLTRARGENAQAGNAGNVLVEAGNVLLTEGARISSTTFGPGQGGTVSVTSDNMVSLSGTSLDGSVTSGMFALAQGTSLEAGNAGDITVESREIRLAAGVEISSTTLGPGQGGTVSLRATETVTVSGASPDGSFVSGIFARAEGGNVPAGDGGNITVNAGSVTISDQGRISSSSSQGGTAGDILLRATDTIRLSNNGRVNTEATNADGGNITMTAGDLIHMSDSQVTSSVAGGSTTTGGNIRIEPRFLVLDNSRILANAFEGTGGNITLIGEVVLADPLSSIDASSALGIDGKVDIQAPIQNLSGTIAPLPQEFQQASPLFAERCAAQKGGQFNSFVIGGRDGIPRLPDGLLQSPLVRRTKPPHKVEELLLNQFLKHRLQRSNAAHEQRFNSPCIDGYQGELDPPRSAAATSRSPT